MSNECAQGSYSKIIVWLLSILLLGSGLGVACSSTNVSTPIPAPRALEVTPEPLTVSPAVPTITSAVAQASPTLTSASLVKNNNRVSDPKQYVFSPLLSFDGIRPVYDPQFSTVAKAPLVDSELVMGVSFGGQAKAYPITVLRFREIVDDDIAGIPILVTW